jgi:hypothetical protein
MKRFIGDGRVSNSGGQDLAVGVREVKEGQLVHHRGCCCAEQRWAWADSDRWSSDGVVLQLGRRQNRDAVECRGEWSRSR